MDVTKAEVIFLIGANPDSQPSGGATWIKNAVKNGTKLIVADPRRTDCRDIAHRFLQFKPDTDVALLNAMMHVIVTKAWLTRISSPAAPSATRSWRATSRPTARKRWRRFAASMLRPSRYVARLYAKSKASMILWGMGVSQHVHGTDNARCLIALALMTGQIGRPGTGLHPLRGQNNVQGASDAGLIPMMYPDYQRVDNIAARAQRLKAAWGTGHARRQAGADRGRGDARDQARARFAACT